MDEKVSKVEGSSRRLQKYPPEQADTVPRSRAIFLPRSPANTYDTLFIRTASTDLLSKSPIVVSISPILIRPHSSSEQGPLFLARPPKLTAILFPLPS